MNAVDRLIAVAEKERKLKYHEGKNGYTKYGDWFAPKFEHAAWCDMFVSWCADQCGLSKVVGRYASCTAHAKWFQAHDHWGRKPRRGAIVFFHMPSGHKGPNHVGIVERVLDDGGIVTIEGNSSDKVARNVRRSHIVGYGYPQYPDGGGSSLSVKVPAFPLPKDFYYGPAKKGPHPVTGHSGPASYREGLKKWQRRMLVRGWGGIGTADGFYSGRTDKVASQFQKEKGLYIDGLIGPDTWKAAWTKPITG
ncbi:CHAP domain-containing protein [Actinoplanes sp. CA-030573]|uniref:CHAP domain-containing protein n=1 Tax=Actinoplanes sp. CA-030573 TaxID=3239898 RepID=UPI003D93718E